MMIRIAFCITFIAVVATTTFVEADSVPKTKEEVKRQGWKSNWHDHSKGGGRAGYFRDGSNDELICDFRKECSLQEKQKAKNDEVCVDYSTCHYSVPPPKKIKDDSSSEIMTVDESVAEVRPTAEQVLEGSAVACLIDPFKVNLGEFYGLDKDDHAVFVNSRREVYNCEVKIGANCLDRVRRGKDFFRCIDPTVCAQNFRTTTEPRPNCRPSR